jgi:hypothetical protein
MDEPNLLDDLLGVEVGVETDKDPALDYVKPVEMLG